MMKTQDGDSIIQSNKIDKRFEEKESSLPSSYKDTIFVDDNFNQTSERISDPLQVGSDQEFHKKKGRRPLDTGLTVRKDVILKRVLRMIRKFFNE